MYILIHYPGRTNDPRNSTTHRSLRPTLHPTRFNPRGCHRHRDRGCVYPNFGATMTNWILIATFGSLVQFASVHDTHNSCRGGKKSFRDLGTLSSTLTVGDTRFFVCGHNPIQVSIDGVCRSWAYKCTPTRNRILLKELENRKW